ncbi:MAG: hypothetical protein ACKPKO_33260 [Candidatus Fonsibacter sp.]
MIWMNYFFIIMYIHFEDLINMKIRLSNLYSEICTANPKYKKRNKFQTTCGEDGHA